jgi:hypothetical protein
MRQRGEATENRPDVRKARGITTQGWRRIARFDVDAAADKIPRLRLFVDTDAHVPDRQQEHTTQRTPPFASVQCIILTHDHHNNQQQQQQTNTNRIGKGRLRREHPGVVCTAIVRLAGAPRVRPNPSRGDHDTTFRTIDRGGPLLAFTHVWLCPSMWPT